MTLQSSPSTSAGLILSPENQVACAQLSSLATPDISQRAAALILLDQGTTQAETAAQSGLSIGQIRYLVKRFREKGMEMFPADLLAKTTNPELPEVSGEELVASEQTIVPAESSPETAVVEPEPATAELQGVEGPGEEGEDIQAEKPLKAAGKARKKASKKRPKRPKAIKKKKSKRKRRKSKNRQG